MEKAKAVFFFPVGFLVVVCDDLMGRACSHSQEGWHQEALLTRGFRVSNTLTAVSEAQSDAGAPSTRLGCVVFHWRRARGSGRSLFVVLRAWVLVLAGKAHTSHSPLCLLDP